MFVWVRACMCMSASLTSYNCFDSHRYISPEGEQVDIVFVADHAGYQPQGAVLPVAPPLPYTRTGHGH